MYKSATHAWREGRGFGRQSSAGECYAPLTRWVILCPVLFPLILVIHEGCGKPLPSSAFVPDYDDCLTSTTSTLTSALALSVVVLQVHR